MRLEAVIVVLIFFSIPIAGQIKQSRQYGDGIEALQKKDTIKAELLFTESIELYKDAPSFYQLGKIQNDKKKTDLIPKAVKNFMEAAVREPDNLQYRLSYASILEQISETKAISEYRKIIESFPNSTEPLVRMGVISFKKYNSNRYAYQEVDEYLRKMSDETKEYFAETEKYFLKALKISSSNCSALIGISLLYFHSENSNRAIQYLIRLCSIDYGDQTAHLLLGCIYNSRGEFDSAEKEFNNAFNLMNKEEMNEYKYDSVVEMLRMKYNINEHYDYRSEIEELINRFWGVYNPSFTSGSKERMLEHYARVTYANLNFSYIKSGIKGWKSDRGSIYLRYGPPDSIVAYKISESNTNCEVWTYKNYIFSFEDQDKNGIFSLSDDNASDSFGNPNSFNLSEELKTNDFQNCKPKGKILNINPGVYFFKNPTDNEQSCFDAYLLHELPLVKGNVDSSISTLFNYTLQLYDNELNLVFSKEGVINRDEIHSVLKDKEGENCVYFSVPPDRGMIVFKLIRLSDNSSYCFHYDYDKMDFSPDEMSISDLLLSSLVETKPGIHGSIMRENYSVFPKPKGEFNQTENAYLYFEIYNLKKWKNDFAYFDREISVVEPEEAGRDFDMDLTDLIKSIFNKKTKLSLSDKFKTNKTNLGQYVRLDISNIKPGDYDVIVKITDKASGKIIEKKSIITIKEAKK